MWLQEVLERNKHLGGLSVLEMRAVRARTEKSYVRKLKGFAKWAEVAKLLSARVGRGEVDELLASRIARSDDNNVVGQVLAV